MTTVLLVTKLSSLPHSTLMFIFLHRTVNSRPAVGSCVCLCDGREIVCASSNMTLHSIVVLPPCSPAIQHHCAEPLWWAILWVGDGGVGSGWIGCWVWCVWVGCMRRLENEGWHTIIHDLTKRVKSTPHSYHHQYHQHLHQHLRHRHLHHKDHDYCHHRRHLHSDYCELLRRYMQIVFSVRDIV